MQKCNGASFNGILLWFHDSTTKSSIKLLQGYDIMVVVCLRSAQIEFL